MPAAQFSSSTGRWYAAKASSSLRKAPAASTKLPLTAENAGSPASDEAPVSHLPAAATGPKPRRTPSQSSAFFVKRARKARAEKERLREANLIVVPIATGKEVQYATREEFDAARKAEDELKKGRIHRAAELFDQGKLPEELRSLVGGYVRPLAATASFILHHRG